ncbi:MAG: hypothetical protein M1823_001583 [Watsoniomyces obsoletus]|nr:MAG: hypothetical protein M1823_001583 [Watsoniomyces obsoletus]
MANKREGSAAGSPNKRAQPTKEQREFLEQMMRDGVDNYDAEGNPIPMRKKRGKSTAQPKKGEQEGDDYDSESDSDDSNYGLTAARAAQQKAEKKQKEKAARDNAKKDAEEAAKPRSITLLPKKWHTRILVNGGAKGTTAWPITTVSPIKPVAPTTNPEITVIPVGQMSDAYLQLKRPGEAAFLRINLSDASTLWVNERTQMTSNVHMLIRDPYRDPKKRTAIVAGRIQQHGDWLSHAKAHYRYRALIWELKKTTWEVATVKTLVNKGLAHKDNLEAKEDLMSRPTWEVLRDVMMSRIIAGVGRGTTRQVPEGSIPNALYDVDGNKTAEQQHRPIEKVSENDKFPKTTKPTAPTAAPEPSQTSPFINKMVTTPFPITSTAETNPHRPLTIGATRAEPGVSQAEKDLASMVNGIGMSIPTIHKTVVQPRQHPWEKDYGWKMNEAVKIFSEKAKKYTAEIEAGAKEKAKRSEGQRAGSV